MTDLDHGRLRCAWVLHGKHQVNEHAHTGKCRLHHTWSVGSMHGIDA